MMSRPDRLKSRIFWSRLFGVALVIFGLILASAAMMAQSVSAADLPCDAASEDDPCDDHSCDDDLCADDCSDCTFCHSIAPTLSARTAALHFRALPHPKDVTPYASVALSSAGPRLFKPPQSL